MRGALHRRHATGRPLHRQRGIIDCDIPDGCCDGADTACDVASCCSDCGSGCDWPWQRRRKPKDDALKDVRVMPPSTVNRTPCNA